MKIISNNNHEFTVIRVTRFYDFGTGNDRVSAEISIMPDDFYESLATADFSAFTLVRNNKTTITFAGYNSVQVNESYEENTDRITIDFSKIEEEEE